MINALRYIKWQLTQISIDKSDPEVSMYFLVWKSLDIFFFLHQFDNLELVNLQARQHVLEAIDQYIDDQIGKAAEAIGKVVKDKIDDNDVILVYAWYVSLNFRFVKSELWTVYLPCFSFFAALH